MRRGQAALEFLISYGWAVLAIVIAFGALTYSAGMYDRWLPARCATDVPFVCTDHKVTHDGKVLLGIANGGADDMTVLNITLLCGGDESQPRSVVLDEFLPAQTRINETFVRFACGPIQGSRYKGDIIIYYRNNRETVTHDATGFLRAYVE